MGGRTGDGSFDYDDDTGEYDVNVTDNAIGAFAVGYDSVAMKDYTVAIGRHATVKNDQSIALGEDATVVADSSVALGYGSVATEENVISVGHKAGDPTYNGGTYSAALNRKIVNVAEGVDDTDAVNVGQMKKARYTAGKNVSISDDNVITAVDTDTTYTAGDNVTIDANNKISATDTTIKASQNALSYDKANGTLSMTVEDTKGNKATGSVQISDIKAAVDTNTTYTIAASEPTGEKGKQTQTTTITLTGDDKSSSSVEVKNDTLVKSKDGLSLNENTLSLNVADTAGNTVTGSVNLSDLAQAVDTNTTYELKGEEDKDSNTTTITLEGSDRKTSTVTVATKDTRNTVEAGDYITVTSIGQADGSKAYTVSAIAEGTVALGDKGLITGDMVYKETRTASDGFVTKTSSTAGENILALDKQVKTNADNINNINQNINSMGSKINKLDNRMDKVGAGAAALAALHPQDFDPGTKWDIAAGFGNYRNENSVALGAFYRPNDDTLFSVGTNFGNGENMVNAGVSVRLGHASEYAGLSRAELVKKIESQDKTLEKQQAEIDELKAIVAKLASK